jgi:hypothetical protein
MQITLPHGGYFEWSFCCFSMQSKNDIMDGWFGGADFLINSFFLMFNSFDPSL